jgi:hypothetical protein
LVLGISLRPVVATDFEEGALEPVIEALGSDVALGPVQGDQALPVLIPRDAELTKESEM